MTKFDKLLEEYGAVEISPDEAREILFRKRPTPAFEITLGEDVVEPLPKSMMHKMNITSDANDISSVRMRELTDKKKLDLPLFSFCVDGKVSAITLDIEDGTCMKQMCDALEDAAYFAYYSASSVLEKPRMRFVLPLLEPVDADIYDYCKDRMIKVFNNIPDPHSFESRRYFFMPSLKCGEYGEDNELLEHRGKPIDFLKTMKFDAVDKLKMKMEKGVKLRRKAEQKSMEDDERVAYYLSHDYPFMTGNGDSASSLYTAICVCLAHDDEETLELVLDKARSENWSENELDRNIEQARKFIGIDDRRMK